MKQIYFSLFIAFLLCCGILQAQTSPKPLYKDPSAPIESRIKDLLGRMTLEDKCHQLDIWHVDATKTSDPQVFQKQLKNCHNISARAKKKQRRIIESFTFHQMNSRFIFKHCNTVHSPTLKLN